MGKIEVGDLIQGESFTVVVTRVESKRYWYKYLKLISNVDINFDQEFNWNLVLEEDEKLIKSTKLLRILYDI